MRNKLDQLIVDVSNNILSQFCLPHLGQPPRISFPVPDTFVMRANNIRPAACSLAASPAAASTCSCSLLYGSIPIVLLHMEFVFNAELELIRLLCGIRTFPEVAGIFPKKDGEKDGRKIMEKKLAWRKSGDDKTQSDSPTSVAF